MDYIEIALIYGATNLIVIVSILAGFHYVCFFVFICMFFTIWEDK